MFLSPIHASFILAMRWGVFQEGRFLGKVLDEWIADSQEFVHTKLPKLIVIAIIAFIFSRLLRLGTHHMTRLAERSSAGLERPLAGIGRHRGHCHRPGRTNHRQRYAERISDPGRGSV